MSQTEPKPVPPSGQPITTTVESPEPCRRVVKAVIARDHYDREYAERLKKAARTHQKSGFRKGRTPRALVEKELGDMLRMETVEALVPKAWMSALLEHKLSPVTDPALENLEFPDDGPLTFDLVVEVKPVIELGDVDGMNLKRREVEVSDADLDGVFERLRESRVEYPAVERAAANDDQILLDLVPGTEAGDFDEEKIIVDERFILGSAQNLEAFNTGLLGCEAGQEKDVAVSYPADHPNPQLQGRTLRFRCRIKEVGEKRLPALDDAFAAAVSPGKTLLELRADIRRDMEQEAGRRVAQELDQQLQAELVRRHDVPLPPSMVDKYLASALEELHRRNAQSGRPNSAEEDEHHRTAGRPHAEMALRAMLLLEAVRRRENIKVESADVDERIEQIAQENGFEVDRYREFIESGGEKERLEYDLLERKTYDFLLSRANIEVVPADTEVFSEGE